MRDVPRLLRAGRPRSAHVQGSCCGPSFVRFNSPTDRRKSGLFAGFELAADRRRDDASLAHRFLVLELQSFDAAAAFGDLVGGGEDLRYVFVGLSERLL